MDTVDNITPILEIYESDLNVAEITNRWYQEHQKSNFGAMIHFIGVVRDEKNIDGLSFDIYAPLLKKWLDDWQQSVIAQKAQLLIAHSKGDVLVHQCSFIAGVLSPHRKVALSLINELVEDFKKNAPIWKYELINNERIYAQYQSQQIDGSGILG